MPDFIFVADEKGVIQDVFEQQTLRFLTDLPEKGWKLSQFLPEKNPSPYYTGH